MFSQKSSTLPVAGSTVMVRRPLTLIGGLLALTLLVAGTQANAQPVRFHYVGGRWAHAYHAGWHRYWGGPSIGFYYAPAPVYVVPGYAAASYYTGPSFWYSNPSFGLSLNFGGGGYYGGRNVYYRHYNGGHYYAPHNVVRGGSFHGGSFHGGSFHGGRSAGGGRGRR